MNMEAQPRSSFNAESFWARTPIWVRFLRRRWRERVVDTVDHDEVMTAVCDAGGLTHRFILMTLASAGIAILGLLQSSPAVVIGAMLVSPLMAPIVAFGFSFAVLDLRQLKHALRTILIGSVLGVLMSVIIVALSPLAQATSEIMARTRPTLLDLLVAVFSAAAGGYAMVRRKSDTLIGVAIATALMPPLAVVGFGLATRQWSISIGAGWLFMTNLLAIALTIAMVARFYGFGAHNSPRQSLWQLGVLSGVFLLLSVPLGFTLRDLAQDGQRSFAVQGAISDEFGAGARTESLTVVETPEGRIRVDGIVFVRDYRAGAGAALKARLERRLDAPVDVAVEQVVVGAQPQQAPLRASVVQQAETLEAQIARRLALRAGLSPAEVSVNLDQRDILLRPAGGDRSLAEWREVERRVAIAEPGFSVRLVPPSGTVMLVRFDNGKMDVDTKMIDEISWALIRLQHPPVDVVAYPDFSTGSRAANLRLAQRRADAVAASLKADPANAVLATIVANVEQGKISPTGSVPLRAVEVRIRE